MSSPPAGQEVSYRPALHLVLRAVPLALLLVLGAVSGTGWANMAAPPEPGPVRRGSGMGEPVGGLREVVIEHERLELDLRPLAAARPARIAATYQVRNQGIERRLQLLFVANGLAPGETRVLLDGVPVPRYPGVAAGLPAAWRAPSSTPSPDSGDAIPYQPTAEGTLGFSVELPRGRHTLRVSYPAAATAYSRNDLTPVWQLGYVLAPAREWGGFGGIEVHLRAPRGWRVRTNPPLQREGGEWVARWDRLPADALAISAQQPEPSSTGWYLLWLGASVAALVLLARLTARLGSRLARGGRASGWALPASTGLALLWAIAAAIAWSQVPELLRWRAGPLASDYRIRAMGYGSAILLMLLIPLMLLVGTLVLQLSAWRAARRARAEAGAAETRPHPPSR